MNSILLGEQPWFYYDVKNTFEKIRAYVNGQGFPSGSNAARLHIHRESSGDIYLVMRTLTEGIFLAGHNLLLFVHKFVHSN